MLYQLPNGNVVKLTEDQYFNMSDEDLRYLQGTNSGYNIDDPFYDSVLDNKEELILKDYELPDDIEELPEDSIDKEKE